MKCAEIQEQLPALSDGRDSALAVRRHISRCPGCRAELARYESLRAGLRGLATHVEEPPAELLQSLIAIPQAGNALDNVRVHVARNRRAYLSGAAVAVAGAALGAVVYKTRKGRLATT